MIQGGSARGVGCGACLERLLVVVLAQDLQQARHRDPRVVVHHHEPARLVAHVHRRCVAERGHEAVLRGQGLGSVRPVRRVVGAVVARRADAVPAVGRESIDPLVAALPVRLVPRHEVLGGRDHLGRSRAGWLVAIDVGHAAHSIVVVRRAPRLVGNTKLLRPFARREKRDEQIPRLQRNAAAQVGVANLPEIGLPDDGGERVVMGEVVVSGDGCAGVLSSLDARRRARGWRRRPFTVGLLWRGAVGLARLTDAARKRVTRGQRRLEFLCGDGGGSRPLCRG